MHMTSLAKNRSHTIKTIRDDLKTNMNNSINGALVNRIVEIREEIVSLLKIIKTLKR